MNDEMYMQEAIALAEKGIGLVNPNPLVGAVIVKDGAVIGRGWHKSYGGLHAERNALQDCQEDPEGAVMYVTLEPCCHQGLTPPCTDAIIRSGIKKVVVGCPDPNPVISGKGLQILQDAGIKVILGVLRTRCEKMNEIFFYYIKARRPFVTMKYAMTLDGKAATVTGESSHNEWISGEAARAKVHMDRKRYSAIMAGVGTVIADDPLLTCRLPSGSVSNPVRIICDTGLRTPPASRIIRTAGEVRTIIATSCQDVSKQEQYRRYGCELMILPVKDNHVDLNVLMMKLGEQRIDSILLEGGGNLNFSALQSGIVNRVQAYIAPKLFGGETAGTPVGGLGIKRIADCIKLKNHNVQLIGEDILVEAEVEKDVYGDY